MDEETFSKLFSYKGEKVKSYKMSYKRDVVKFAQKHSINLAAPRFGVTRKRMREWIRSCDEITARAPTKKILDGGGRKLALRKKCPYLELFCPYFPAFGLNTERYGVF